MSDPRFATPEGIAPGSSLEDVLRAGATQPINERGWAAYATLTSGWSAAFGMLTTVPDNNIDAGMTAHFSVEWVFQRAVGAGHCVCGDRTPAAR